MYFVRSGVTRASIGSPQPSQTPFIMSYNGKIQTANHATKPLGILPRFHHVAFSDPPEQQCYLTTINTLPPGWCIPVFPFRSGANERNRKWEPTQHFQPRSPQSWRTMPSYTIFSLPPFRHTPAAERRRKKQFYTLCIIDGMNIASIFVIAQYCRPKSLREAPK